ncbi:hypothetical protein EVAR_10527_1 [Eumeta japonica]|uniref:Uncharacterized protein n=1 Tax=Eumeta variegata TaxID=151549 RepID=A0A4C1TK47_EUMVA|nr:hypothetical protein EVAR_10527_1 [Eumeta japonica]
MAQHPMGERHRSRMGRALLRQHREEGERCDVTGERRRRPHCYPITGGRAIIRREFKLGAGRENGRKQWVEFTDLRVPEIKKGHVRDFPEWLFATCTFAVLNAHRHLENCMRFVRPINFSPARLARFQIYPVRSVGYISVDEDVRERKKGLYSHIVLIISAIARNPLSEVASQVSIHDDNHKDNCRTRESPQKNLDDVEPVAHARRANGTSCATCRAGRPISHVRHAATRGPRRRGSEKNPVERDRGFAN